MGQDPKGYKTRSETELAMTKLTELVNKALPLGPIRLSERDVERFLIDHFKEVSDYAHVWHRGYFGPVSSMEYARKVTKAGAPSGWATFQMWNDPSRLVAVDVSTVTAVVSDNQGDNTRTTIRSTNGVWNVGESWNVVLQRLNAAKEASK